MGEPQISVGQWVVYQSSGPTNLSTTRVDDLTAKLVKTHRYGSRFAQTPRSSVVAAFDAHEQAAALVEAVDKAKRPFIAERRDEGDRHREAMASITDRMKTAVSAVLVASLIQGGSHD